MKTLFSRRQLAEIRRQTAARLAASETHREAIVFTTPLGEITIDFDAAVAYLRVRDYEATMACVETAGPEDETWTFEDPFSGVRYELAVFEPTPVRALTAYRLSVWISREVAAVDRLEMARIG
jgi:hypothetical protein